MKIKWNEVQDWLRGNFEDIEILGPQYWTENTQRWFVSRIDRGKKLSATFEVSMGGEGHPSRELDRAAVALGSWKLNIDASPVLGRDWKTEFPEGESQQPTFSEPDPSEKDPELDPTGRESD